MSHPDAPTVLLTDRAWPDDTVERTIVEGAGFRLVSGPADPASAETIEALEAWCPPTLPFSGLGRTLLAW